MRTPHAIIAAAALLLFGGCELFTGPGERFMGVIGYETQDGFEAGEGRAAVVPALYATAEAGRDTVLHCEGWDPLPASSTHCGYDAPDTVTADAPFEITVRTSGPAGCTVPDGADVSGSDTMIEVVPYDRISGPNCAGATGTLSRTVELEFPEPGDALLRITGRILIVRDSVVDERVGSLDHPIVVR